MISRGSSFNTGSAELLIPVGGRSAKSEGIMTLVKDDSCVRLDFLDDAGEWGEMAADICPQTGQRLIQANRAKRTGLPPWECFPLLSQH